MVRIFHKPLEERVEEQTKEAGQNTQTGSTIRRNIIYTVAGLGLIASVAAGIAYGAGYIGQEQQEQVVRVAPQQINHEFQPYLSEIRQHNPELADLLSQEDVMEEYNIHNLRSIHKAVLEGNYTLDYLVSGTNKTAIFAISNDEYRRAVGLQIAKESIPVIAGFLGVDYSRPLLITTFDKDISSGGSGQINVSKDGWGLSEFTHEAGHEVSEVYPLNVGNSVLTSVWFTEGIAEFAGRYAASEFKKNHPELFEKLKSEGLHAPPVTTDVDEAYQSMQNSIEFAKSQEKRVADVIRGFVFFYEYLQLLGQENFSDALGHVYDVKVARAIADPEAVSRGEVRITDQEIEKILEQHVPLNKLLQFKQLYQTRIYDLSTNPN